MFHRIVIIGPCGAGKSTLSVRLRDQLSLPLIHLDKEYWQPGWIEPPKLWWTMRIEQLLARPRWIMDGNFNGSMVRRFEACDTIVYLDFPSWRCTWNVAKRVVRYAGRTRPDMAPACAERLDWAFMEYVLTFNREQRPKLLARLEKFRSTRRVFQLRDYDAVEGFLQDVRHVRQQNVPRPA